MATRATTTGNLRQRRRAVLRVVMCAGLLMSALYTTGCDDVRRRKATDPVKIEALSAPVTADAMPGEVVRALLEAAVAFQKIRLEGLGSEANRRSYDQTLGILRGLTAGDVIFERMRRQNSVAIPPDITLESAEASVIETWVSQLAYYIEGIQFDTLQSIPGDQTATVYVTAENPEDRRRLNEIVSTLDLSTDRDAEGQPIRPGSAAYYALLREKTLPLGFNVPIETRIDVRLVRSDGVWRVSRLSVGPPSTRITPDNAAEFNPDLPRVESRPAG